MFDVNNIFWLRRLTMNILVLFLLVKYCRSEFQISHITQNNISICIENIATKSFEVKDVVLIYQNPAFLEQYKVFIFNRISRIIAFENFEKVPIIGPFTYILLLENFSVNMSAFMQSMDVRGKYIIVYHLDCHQNDLIDTFRASFDTGVPNITVAIHKTNSLQFFTWNPYEYANKCGKFVRLRKKSCTKMINKGDFRIFRPKVINLMNCKLRVAWVHNPPFVTNPTTTETPGIFQTFLEILSRYSRITIEYESENYEFSDEFLYNGTYHRLIDHLRHGKADMALSRLYMNDTESVPLDYGPMVYKDEVLFVTRLRRKFKSYGSIFRIYKRNIWLSFLTVLGIITFLLHVGAKLLKEKKKESPIKLVMELYRISLAMGSKLLYNSLSLRFLHVIFMIYCLTLCQIYVGKLSSSLAVADQERALDGLDALIEYEIHTFISWHLERICKATYFASFDETTKEGLHIENSTELQLLRKVAVDQENGTMIFTSIAETYPAEIAAVEIVPWYFELNMYLVYYLRKRNPLNPIINYCAQEIFESGFFDKWWRDFAENTRKNFTPPAEPDENLIVLELKHFANTFYLLLMGCGVSALVLVLEITYKIISDFYTNTSAN